MEKYSEETADYKLCTAALSSLGTGAVITDQEATIIYVNKSFEEITGYTAQEAVGQKMSLLKSGHQSKEFYEELWEAIEGAGQWRGTLWNKRKNGVVYHERLNIRRFMDDSGRTCFVGIFSDISEQDELQRALIDAQKRELMVTMIGGIAHNFNNYMAAVNGFSYLGEKAAKDEKTKRYFSEIYQATTKNAHLVQRLMKISRPSKHANSYFNLAGVVRKAVETEKSIIPENIDITYHVTGEEECFVKGDPTDIEQAIFNLINNSRDALRDIREPKIKLEVILSHKWPSKCQHYCPRTNYCPVSTETNVIIIVEDNGIGIPEDMQARVFTPFFTTKDPDKGTGLGLASVNQVVNRLGGAIWVTSRVNVGTRFTICLPRVD